MKIYIIIFFLAMTCLLSAAQWEWVKGYGSSSLDRVWDLAIDNQGNLYVTGEFIDTLMIQETTLTGWGLNDIFVAKINPNGALQWAKVFGGVDGDVGVGIDVDAAGNTYTTGYFASTANFGDQVVTAVDSWDIFILKLDTDGNVEWVKTEGSTSNDIGYGIATTPEGTSIITGWFGNTMTFHDGSTMTSFGGSDVLVMSVNTEGNILWKHKAGTAAVEYGYKVDVDYFGNAYVTGVCGTGSDFDGMYAPGGGLFIASYSQTGLIRWVNSGAGAGVNSIAVDSRPALIEQSGCVTGRLTGSATFDTFSLTSYNGTDDAFNGVFELLTGHWTSAIVSGGAGSDKGRACTYGPNPFYAGSYEETFDLFGFPVVSGGASDSYVYGDVFGPSDWLLTGGGVNNDVVTDIGSDAEGNIYVCGWYSGIAFFGDTQVLNSGGDSDLDMFIAKIDPNPTSNSDDVAQSVQSLIKCYPNPFSQNINIELKNSQNEPAEISIYNTKGQRVWGRSVESNETTLNWDGKASSGETCASGLYIVRCKSSNHSIDSRLIVKVK